jgi:membrane protein DedA with SNARE-associated domain
VTPSRAARGDDAGPPVSALTSLQVGSVLSYVIAIVIPALDAVIPVLPSETVIIALGVATAGSADPRIGLLVACAALGAFLGDNLSYLLGRRFVVATAVAGLIWASYSFTLGRLGGRAFEDAPWAGFAVAFGVTIAVSGLVELIRRIVSRRRAAATSEGHPAGPAEADRSSSPVHHTGDNCPARPRS